MHNPIINQPFPQRGIEYEPQGITRREAGLAVTAAGAAIIGVGFLQSIPTWLQNDEDVRNAMGYMSLSATVFGAVVLGAGLGVLGCRPAARPATLPLTVPIQQPVFAGAPQDVVDFLVPGHEGVHGPAPVVLGPGRSVDNTAVAPAPVPLDVTNPFSAVQLNRLGDLSTEPSFRGTSSLVSHPSAVQGVSLSLSQNNPASV